jgi:hypothetical protein
MQKARWQIVQDRAIRTIPNGTLSDLTRQCPLAFAATVATGQYHSTNHYHDAAKTLKMDPLTRELIVNAADTSDSALHLDGYRDCPSQRLRRLMMKVVKL